jgi:conjugative transfer signal peptidase TraF
MLTILPLLRGSSHDPAALPPSFFPSERPLFSGTGAGAFAVRRPRPVRRIGARLHTKAPLYIILIAAMLVAGMRLIWPKYGPELIVNYTHSEPDGIYRLKRVELSKLQAGQMVAFPVPEQFRELVIERGWVNAGHPLMKHVGALAGDLVCIADDGLRINSAFVGPVFTVDSMGQPMPRVRGCMMIGEGQFFPISTHTDKSFDGRYIGPQPLSAVVGVLYPVWTF